MQLYSELQVRPTAGIPAARAVPAAEWPENQLTISQSVVLQDVVRVNLILKKSGFVRGRFARLCVIKRLNF